MAIKFHCPSCNLLLSSTENPVGRKFQCPGCGLVFIASASSIHGSASSHSGSKTAPPPNLLPQSSGLAPRKPGGSRLGVAAPAPAPPAAEPPQPAPPELESPPELAPAPAPAGPAESPEPAAQKTVRDEEALAPPGPPPGSQAGYHILAIIAASAMAVGAFFPWVEPSLTTYNRGIDEYEGIVVLGAAGLAVLLSLYNLIRHQAFLVYLYLLCALVGAGAASVAVSEIPMRAEALARFKIPGQPVHAEDKDKASPKAGEPKTEPPKTEEPKTEEPKTEAAKTEAAKKPAPKTSEPVKLSERKLISLLGLGLWVVLGSAAVLLLTSILAIFAARAAPAESIGRRSAGRGTSETGDAARRGTGRLPRR